MILCNEVSYGQNPYFNFSIGGGLDYKDGDAKLNGVAAEVFGRQPDMLDRWGLEVKAYIHKNVQGSVNLSNNQYSSQYIKGAPFKSTDTVFFYRENGSYTLTGNTSVAGIELSPLFRLNSDPNDKLLLLAGLRIEYALRQYEYSYSDIKAEIDSTPVQVSELPTNLSRFNPAPYNLRFNEYFWGGSFQFIGHFGDEIEVAAGINGGIVFNDEEIKAGERRSWYWDLSIAFTETKAGVRISTDIRTLNDLEWNDGKSFFTFNIVKQFSIAKLADAVFGTQSKSN